MKNVLTGISIAVWQCFSIKRALHPYSVSSLEEMKEVFRVQDLFPVLSQASGHVLREFASASITDAADLSNEEEESEDNDDEVCGDDVVLSHTATSSTSTSTFTRGIDQSTAAKKITIAVDDSSLFDKLRVILEERKVFNICWIDGSNNDSTDNFNASSASVFDHSEGMTYDLEALKDDTEQSLNMSQEEFAHVCGDLQAKTFFAPISSAPLYQFLEIPTLSGLFTERIQSTPQVQVPPVTSLSLTSRMHKYLNALLEIAQRQVIMDIGEFFSVLVGTARMQRVVNLTIKECSSLDKYRDMNASHLGPEFDDITISQSIQFCWSWSGDAPLIVFIRSAISVEDLLDLCINLIMQPLSVEIAIMKRNRENELMQQIRKNMKKFAKKPDVRFAFEYDDIPDLPIGVDPWSVLSCIDNEDIIGDKSSKEEEEEAEVVEIKVYTEAEQLKIDEYNKAVQEREQNRANRNTQLKKQQVAESPAEILDPKYYATSTIDEANKAYVSQRTEEMKNIAEYYVATPDVGVMPLLDTTHYERTRHPSGGGRFTADDGSGDFDKYSVTSKSEAQGLGRQINYEGGHRDHAYEGTGNTVQKVDYTVRGPDHTAEKGDFTAAESRGGDGYVELGRGSYSRLAGDTGKRNTSSDVPPALYYPAYNDNTDNVKHIGEYGLGYSNAIGQGNGQGFGGDYNNFSPMPILTLDLSGMLSSDAFTNLTLASINGDNAGGSTDLGSKALACNATTGRLGEHFAFEYLKNQQAALGLTSVIWINEYGEALKPFDICMTTRSGMKYCEVKATSFSGEIGSKGSVQWFISSAEVKAAEEIGKDYFAICLSIAVDKISGKPAPSAIYMIGWERGLSDSLLRKEASLLLQVNT